MCTLVIAAGVVPGYRLVVIANRDEQRDRPSTPPFRWPAGFLAPRDEVAGGTWLGLSRGSGGGAPLPRAEGERRMNAHGVFVGITNRFLGPRDTSRISRGALVAAVLEEPSARAIHARLSRLEPAAYNGFHLVYADASDVLVTIGDGHDLAQLSLGDGLHLITERAFGAASDARRRARIEAAWTAWRATTPLSLDRATRVLAEHDDLDPLGATCIHLDALSYGTRSAMVLGMPVDATQPPSMWWAEGPPCTTPFVAIRGEDPVTAVSAPPKTG